MGYLVKKYASVIDNLDPIRKYGKNMERFGLDTQLEEIKKSLKKVSEELEEELEKEKKDK
ncbi:hypothetical protein KKD87_02945 [bacterium]|nr:hypothetical protein [bacterium]MBU1782309.1 hypothetical protein [bacterium]MBU2599780.1 hypothetical protein [bacterium]